MIPLSNLRVIPPEDLAKHIPQGLLDALSCPNGDVIYCHVCDGLRLKQHTCHEWYPGIALQINPDGSPTPPMAAP